MALGREGLEGVLEGASVWKGRGLGGDMGVGGYRSLGGDMSVGGCRSLGGDNRLDGCKSLEEAVVWVGAIAWVGARAWEGTAGHGPGMGQEYRVVQYPRK